MNPAFPGVTPDEAARRYALRRAQERQVDGRIPAHGVFDGPNRKLAYAGTARESGHALALLGAQDMIWIVPIDEKTCRALARKPVGSHVLVRDGRVAIGSGRGHGP